ncbi:MAG: YceI family protein [SAR202 cluster bacterium]|nr:YceI family protein [SAR202 cluster bacterium]|tara:strand:+ start:270 stop:1034 length:765 start_codon:yes stop_codon:yes gene_type:complete
MATNKSAASYEEMHFNIRMVLDFRFILGVCGLIFLVTGCQNTSPESKSPKQIVVPTEQHAKTGTATPTVLTPQKEDLRITVGPNSHIKYLVREQLANRDLPNDAIGVSKELFGFLSLNKDGSIKDESVISVDLSTFKSDSARRDRYLQRQTFEIDKYPTVRYEILDVKGLQWPLPNTENLSFQITGDMTLHGETRTLNWEVLASHSEGKLAGTAKTKFAFDDFNLDIPNLFFILDVENEIRLELIFDAAIEPYQ